MRESKTIQNLKAAALVLLNATILYSVVGPIYGWRPLASMKQNKGSWHLAMEDAFQTAWKKDYRSTFGYALRVLRLLSPGTSTEAALMEIYSAGTRIVSQASFLRLDLMGRVFHTILSKELRKVFATFYTSVSAAELLASLAITNPRDRVVDFACGTGTLLIASYHRKLMLLMRSVASGRIPSDFIELFHKSAAEDEIWGFDAMGFATHIAATNLAYQQPSYAFDRSRIYHVSTAGKLLGSLELLDKNVIYLDPAFVEEQSVGATMQSVDAQKPIPVALPSDGFDVVMMNPPFTRSDRQTKALDTITLSKRLEKIGAEISVQAGLAAPFVILADIYLKKGGRVAFVLPTAILSREEWQPIREMLLAKYWIEFVVLSWAEGKPSFSESTELRELLLVAKKLNDNEQAGSTLVLGLGNWPSTPLDMRPLADQARGLLSSSDLIMLVDGNSYTLKTGGRKVGVAYALKRTLLDKLPTWSFLTTFHDLDLAKLYLVLRGLAPPHEDDPLILPQVPNCPLGAMGQIQGEIDHVESVGLRHQQTKSNENDVPVLWGVAYRSGLNTIEVQPDKITYIGAEPSGLRHLSQIKRGNLLVMRRTDIFTSTYVWACHSATPVASNMWWPINANTGKTTDGQSFTADEAGKVTALWYNTIGGLLIVLGERAETRGTWSEWKKGLLETLPTLDLRQLQRQRLVDLLKLYEEFRGYKWPLLKDQLSSPPPERQALDEKFYQIVSGKKPENLGEIYSRLGTDINRLVAIMTKPRTSKGLRQWL